MRIRVSGFGVAHAVVLAAALLVGTVATAGKPPAPPSVDSGLIYYIYNSGGSVGLYSMKPDGSAKTWLTAPLAVTVGEPSMGLHYCLDCGKDVRWFLDVACYGTGTYPNDRPRGELHVMCEAGHVVRLTEAPNLEPDNMLNSTYAGTPYYQTAYPRWTDGDSVVTYMAKQWTFVYDTTSEEWVWEVTEYGLYALEIDPDNLDSHVPDSPMLLDVVLDLLNPDNWEGGHIWSMYDWSPDGTEIVYQRGSPGLWYAKAPDWTPEKIRTGGENPRWSPDGSQIGFRDGGWAICVMDPDPATNPDHTETCILEAPESSGSMDYMLYGPDWSPNGTHIAYVLYGLDSRRWRHDIDIRRATASGGDIADLTKTLPASDGKAVAGWR